MAGVVKVDDVGTLIKLDSGVDLTAASTVEIVARNPSGSIETLSASVVETTKAQHVKAADTLDVAGSWELQVHAVWGTGEDLSGDEVSLRIYGSLRS